MPLAARLGRHLLFGEARPEPVQIPFRPLSIPSKFHSQTEGSPDSGHARLPSTDCAQILSWVPRTTEEPWRPQRCPEQGQASTERVFRCGWRAMTKLPAPRGQVNGLRGAEPQRPALT